MKTNARTVGLLRDMPIKRKLTIISMLSSGLALLLACAAFLTYDLTGLRENMVNDMSSAAAIVADNSVAALSFNDPASAKQTLSSLATHPHIAGAAIYDKDGHVFAAYRRAGFRETFGPLPSEIGYGSSDRDYFRLYRRINFAGENVGTVYIQTDMDRVKARVRRYALIFVLVMIFASGSAFLLSRKLQTVISAPVSHLAGVVSRVASSKDYSIRAVAQGRDELGELIDGFNGMLGQIQARDSALQEIRGELEQRVEERTRELANSLSLLNSTIESTADGILAHQFSSGAVCHNSQYRTMWEIPPGLLNAEVSEHDRVLWNARKTKDPERFVARLREIQKEPQNEYFDFVELADGRVFERYIKPQWVDGKNVGVVINFRDVTERKRAELALEEAHKRLLQASRQAGMAEVATNVLHNVGNVLNSVNVSASMVTEYIQKSKIAALPRIVSLLAEHEKDLGAFLTGDSRGKHLPAYLAQLSHHLLTERNAATRELESLRNNIEHIKQIVQMQQNYSKVSGVKEIVNVVDLVEDTLRMNQDALDRHGVKVVREFDKVPPINTEKHKILQILVNLVRNAKIACSESDRSEKCLTLRVGTRNDKIMIAVADNGVGIAPENLTRIFSHGFTTRKDGHGFGLHSGALAARELGGSLYAHSEGLGQGATFILELPKEVREPTYV